MTPTTPSPSAWTHLRATLDPITRRLTGNYLAYSLNHSEYISTEYGTPELFRGYLTAKGYVPQRLSAAKRHPESGRLHVVSMRRRPREHPDAVAGTALAEYAPRVCQFHVHAFGTDVRPYLDVFSHLELAPDIRLLGNESVSDAISRIKMHYKPTYDFPDADRKTVNYLRGVKDPALDL